MQLDGIWDFHFENHKFIDELDLNGIVFDEICTVPGCFDVMPGHLCKRGCGIYRRKVVCGGPCKLEIGGLGLVGRVYFDGCEIDRIHAAFSDRVIRFDAGTKGEHEIRIICCNRYDGKKESQFREYYDFYGYGGIYRSIELTEIPEYDIESLRITTLDAAKRKLRAEVQIHGSIPEEKSFFVDEKKIGDFSFNGNTASAEFELAYAGLWSPDHPELHTFRFLDENIRFGIRTIKAEKGKLWLNGEELWIRGICRHDAHPEFGYAVPETILVNDLISIKEHGFNCIRGSHYPQSKKMLEICDRIGLMVWDETLGWQNNVVALTDTEFTARQLEQVKDIVRLSANHPCVILWGFLNEAITNVPEARPIVKTLVDAYHAADPGRPVTFATMFQDKDACADLVDVISLNIYPGWYLIKESDWLEQEFQPQDMKSLMAHLAEYAQQKWPEKPLLISEIGGEAQAGDHSGLRWSEEYQRELLLCAIESVKELPRYSGLFLWLFCDTRSYSNHKAQERARGFNSKGLVDEYRRPKLSWLAMKK